MTPSWPTRIACPIVGVQLMLLSKIVDGRILFGCHYPTTNEWQSRRFSMSSVPQFTARGASHQNFPQAGQTHTAPNGLQLNFPSTERHLPYRGCAIKTLQHYLPDLPPFETPLHVYCPISSMFPAWDNTKNVVSCQKKLSGS